MSNDRDKTGPHVSLSPAEAPRRGWFIAATIAIALAAGFATFTKVFNNDIFWHLAAGDWMLSHGRVLSGDPFSIDPMPQWVNVHWLFQVIVAALHAVGGFAILTVLKSALAVGTVVLLAVAARHEAPPVWLVIAGLVTAVVLESRVRVRPEAFTLFFMMAVITLVESVRRGGPARRLWWLAAIMLPWANMHGLYFLGPALFWSAMIGVAIDRALGRGQNGDLLTRRAFWPMLAASAVCLATPWPLKAAAQPLLLWTRISGQTKAFTEVLEFIPTWDSRYFLYLAIALLVPTVIACALNARRMPVAHWIWLVAFGVLAMMARRNVALAGPVCGYLLAIHGGQVIRRVDSWQRGRTARPPSSSAAVLVNLAAICLALAFAAGCATELLFRVPGFGVRFGPGLNRAHYPIDGAKYLGSLEGPGDIFCEDWGDAGTFIYFSRPRRLWMDPRLEAHTVQRFERQQKIADAMGNVGTASTVELPPSVRFLYVRCLARRALTAMACSPRYRLIHMDETGVCFVRTDFPGGRGALPAGDNLADFDRPLRAPGVIEGLEPNVHRWWRQNPPSRYYPIGQEMLWLAWRPSWMKPQPWDDLRDRAGLLAVRYLEAALTEGFANRRSAIGMLAQAYQQRARLTNDAPRTVLGPPTPCPGPDDDAPIDFLSARALWLYGRLDLDQLDNEDIRSFAVEHVDALARAGRIDAAEHAAARLLQIAPYDLPDETRQAWKRLRASLAAAKSASELQAGNLSADPADRARLLASPSIGLVDAAIATLQAVEKSERTPEINVMLGNLLLNGGDVDAARTAYKAAGPRAGWRLVVCDWVQGLFVGPDHMPDTAPAQARRYEALRREILGLDGRQSSSGS